MTSFSAGHVILTPTKPIGRGRPDLRSNPRPSHQELRALPTELTLPPFTKKHNVNRWKVQAINPEDMGTNVNSKIHVYHNLDKKFFLSEDSKAAAVSSYSYSCIDQINPINFNTQIKHKFCCITLLPGMILSGIYEKGKRHRFC